MSVFMVDQKDICRSCVREVIEMACVFVLALVCLAVMVLA